MAEPHWTSYVGMVTGAIGAVMGFIAYWRSNKIIGFASRDKESSKRSRA